MVKHKTGKLSKRDPNKLIANIPELQFHFWFSAILGFAPEETEAERIQDESKTSDSEQEK